MVCITSFYGATEVYDQIFHPLQGDTVTEPVAVMFLLFKAHAIILSLSLLAVTFWTGAPQILRDAGNGHKGTLYRVYFKIVLNFSSKNYQPLACRNQIYPFLGTLHEDPTLTISFFMLNSDEHKIYSAHKC